MASLVNDPTNNNTCPPRVLINSILNNVPKRLNICHLNVGSVFPKHDELKFMFRNTNVHIIVFSETWFKSKHSNSTLCIDGFNLIRNDRVRKRSGGVAIYIKSCLKYKIVKLSEDIATEYLFLEIIFPDSKILIGAVYKAPSVDEINILTTDLLELTDCYDNIIIAGDFNENLLAINSNICRNCVNKTCRVCRFMNMISLFPSSPS